MERPQIKMKRPRACRPLPPRKSDAALLAEYYGPTLIHALKQAAQNGSRRLVFRIDLPDAAPGSPTQTIEYAFPVPQPVRFLVVEADGETYDERGEVETWEAACELLDSLRGTQERGQALQIHGLDEEGYVAAYAMLRVGVRRGY